MVTAAHPQSFKIASSALAAEFCPALGGRMSVLRHVSDTDIVTPLANEPFEPLYWPKAGAYPLAPYHNRITDARLQTRDGSYLLRAHPQALPHALHGPAQLHSWSVEDHSPSSLTMAFATTADEDWPWAYEASQTFELHDNLFSLRLSVKNNGGNKMPAGLAWHPYFRTASAISHDASYLWPHRSDFVPEGSRIALAERPDARSAKTAYLDSWTTVRFPIAPNLEIGLTASAEFQHLVIHQVDDYSCIEPATHVANGFNMAFAGVGETGMHELEPGQTLEGTIFLRINENH